MTGRPRENRAGAGIIFSQPPERERRDHRLHRVAELVVENPGRDEAVSGSHVLEIFLKRIEAAHIEAVSMPGG